MTLADVFTSRAPVNRRLYLTVGIALMALKYGVDGAVALQLTGNWPSPLVYLAPLMSMRLQLLGGSPPDAVVTGLALWTLPFAWIGVTLSVRRARDAGLPAWVGLGFLLPFLNYLLMAVLAAMPTKAAVATTSPQSDADRPLWSALMGVFVGAAYLVPVALFAILVGSNYGASVFMGAPLLSGALAGYYHCRGRERSAASAIGIGVATQLVAAALLLLFALEGVICLMMALPIACAAGAFGGLLGRAIAGLPRSSWKQGLGAPMLLLPVLVAADPGTRVERVVASSVEIDASPEAVWDVVIGFPEIPADRPTHWLFDAGVAKPIRARIEGRGVGAVRHCEFTTGAFVEPVTTWDPPRHLAFDVTEQPEPMREMSPWPSVFAPHLEDGTLRSHRGEFVLEPLPGGRTRLVGRTWYSVAMAPEPYWAAWTETIVHEVHLRVLGHIADVAAAGARTKANADR